MKKLKLHIAPVLCVALIPLFYILAQNTEKLLSREVAH